MRSFALNRPSDEPYLDGLRAVAVILVLTYHCDVVARTHNFVVDRLYIGVDLFFVLSGFLLARPWFARPRPSYWRFMRRRFARVVPAYYVSVMLTLAIYGALDVIPTQMLTGMRGLVNIGAHLLFVHGYVPMASSDFNFANHPWWTMTVEMTWYVVLPIVVWAFVGRRWRAALPLTLCITAGWMWLWFNHLDGFVTALDRHVDPVTMMLTGLSSDSASWVQGMFVGAFPAFLWTFVLGVVLAKVQVSRKQPIINGTTTSLGLVVVACLMVPLFWVSRDSGQQAYYRIGYGTLIAAGVGLLAFGPAVIRRPFEWLPLRVIGWVSFSIYLIHVPVIDMANRHGWFHTLGPWTTLGVLTVTTFGISFVYAVVSWIVVERAFLVPDSRRHRQLAVVGLVIAAVVSWVIGTRPSATEKQWQTVAFATQEANVVPLFSFLPNVVLSPESSGPMTAQEGFKREFVDQETSLLLFGCRHQDSPGSVYSGLGHEVMVTATAYECSNEKAAETVVDETRQHADAFGLERSGAGLPSSLVLRGIPNAGDVRRGHDHVQIRYRSGLSVVTIEIVGPDSLTATQYAIDLWHFAVVNYPVT